MTTQGMTREMSARGEGLSSAGRSLVSAVVLFAIFAALAAGSWGALSSLRAEAPAARLGETVSVPGGSLRVDAFIPEHMAHAQTGKFAASGMSMSSMGMDMAPEGKERFAVEVTLGADEAAGLAFSHEDFRVYGEGLESTAPIRHHLAGRTVPAGGAVSGVLVFQVPEDSDDLRLSFDGGRPVALETVVRQDGGGGRGEEHEH